MKLQLILHCNHVSNKEFRLSQCIHARFCVRLRFTCGSKADVMLLSRDV
jgi:hypothetical protein